jgi:hypothetical protein
MSGNAAKSVPGPLRGSGRVFGRDATVNGRIVSANAVGSNRNAIVDRCRVLEGVAVDLEHGRVCWTDLGSPSENDGSIERVGLDDSSGATFAAPGDSFTSKLLQIEHKRRRLYGSSRLKTVSPEDTFEGLRFWLREDGSGIGSRSLRTWRSMPRGRMCAIGEFALFCTRLGERALDKVQSVVFKIAMSAPLGDYESETDAHDD